MSEKAPLPAGVDKVTPLQAVYYEAAYLADSSSEIAAQLDADLQDSPDQVETLRRWLSYTFARGAAFGHRDPNRYPNEEGPE